MNIPTGLTENRAVDIMYAVCERIAPRFRFGYHSNEDMIQQGVQECVKVLNKGMFTPKNDHDPVQVEKQLRVFLSLHIHRRLHNYKRDNCKRPGKNSSANDAKFNIMHPLKIDQFDDADFLFSYRSDHEQRVENKDMIKYFAKTVDPNLAGDIADYIESLSDDDYNKLVGDCREELENGTQEN